MFTSLRSRLWLSYAIVISVALSVVAVVLFVFLIRNPLASRRIQQQLRSALSQVAANPKQFADNSDSLARVAQTNNVRLLVFNSSRNLISDTDLNAPPLPFPRRNALGRTVQTARDANGETWLYAFTRLSPDRILVAAAPRPSVPVLNIFRDDFLRPVIQGGVIALLLSLVLAFTLSRWVADPLQQLVAAARNYPKGSQELHPILPRGPHEVQDLTRAFNSMVARLQSSQKSQRDFVANVSHELKTPLTSIQGFAQAILDDTANTPKSRKQAAQIIYNEAARMHRMALDLLDLARLEAGTADLQMSPVDIGVLLRSVLERFAPQAQKSGVHLQLSIPENLPTVMGDGDRLAQVLNNLVDNALKFTPADGIITLSAVNRGNELELSVSDTGKGVPQEALPRLFDRFYQVDTSRSRTGGETAVMQRGAGLGLAIVQEIVQAHGGRINVRSEVGHGTTFVIHLPLVA